MSAVHKEIKTTERQNQIILETETVCFDEHASKVISVSIGQEEKEYTGLVFILAINVYGSFGNIKTYITIIF